jgi:hypothetical protein
VLHLGTTVDGATGVKAARRLAGAAENKDHARLLPDHVARARPRRQESRPRRRLDRGHEIVDRHLRHRRSERVRVRDQVGGNVEASSLGDDSVGVLVHRPLIERVNLRRLDQSAG